MRGLERIYGVARQTVARWLKKALALPPLEDTLLLAQDGDVLDEIWSFVGKKEQARWTWTVMCRRTRQIVAFVIGDRSEATCWQLWEQTTTALIKACGETNHLERWNNTLRQRCARYVRQTLSF